jgi:hypothetical protein
MQLVSVQNTESMHHHTVGMYACIPLWGICQLQK